MPYLVNSYTVYPKLGCTYIENTTTYIYTIPYWVT